MNSKDLKLILAGLSIAGLVAGCNADTAGPGGSSGGGSEAGAGSTAQEAVQQKPAASG